MAIYIYMRCSTEHQDYAQQRETINRWLTANRLTEKDITKEVVEKRSGLVKHDERKLAGLLKLCEVGDTILISELSRLGRNMNDLHKIVGECCERGVTILQCKDGQKIENDTIQGKALLFALSLAAEIEVNNLRQRTQAGVSAALAELKRNGKRMTRNGTIQDHWGNEKGCDMSYVQEASCVAKIQASIRWKEQSKGYNWAIQQIAKGKPRKQVIEEFNELHEQQPDIYCTREGKPLSAPVLSRWISQANPILP